MNDPVEVAARTAWGEARGEGEDGMRAVLCCIANRVASPGWWGHDIVSVCLENDQYSCWNTDDPNRSKLLAVTDSDDQFKIALALAASLVSGTLADTTRGSDSYYATNSPPPKWASGRSYRIIIGHHIFFRVGLIGNGR